MKWDQVGQVGHGISTALYIMMDIDISAELIGRLVNVLQSSSLRYQLQVLISHKAVWALKNHCVLPAFPTRIGLVHICDQ